MAMSQRSRVAICTGLCTVVDEAAVVELLSFFPVRDVEQPALAGRAEQPEAGIDASIAERLARIEARLTQLEACIEILATDTRDGLARIEQLIVEDST